jgi:hypothetical protein
LRDITWLDRVPAEKRAMNSFNWAIFFSRCAFPLRCASGSASWPAPCRRTRRVGDHGLVIDIGDVRANAVQKMPVVRNHDQHAFVVAQIILQPVHRFQIEVVGGLVEQQRRRAAEQSLRQQHAHFLAALQFAHRPLVQRRFHAQAVQQHGGVGFRRVAAFFADDAFQLAQPHAVRIGELVVRLGVQCVAFFQRAPERRIAHDHGVDHAEPVEGELVLAQHAELLGRETVPLAGSNSPVRIFISVDFPAPLGPVMA